MVLGLVEWLTSVSYITVLLVLPVIHCGCYQTQLCCLGFNLTCVANDNASQQFLRKQRNFPRRCRHPLVFDVNMNPIGKLVTPDLVALGRDGMKALRRHGSTFAFNSWLLLASSYDTNLSYQSNYWTDQVVKSQNTSSTLPFLHHKIVFGEPFNSNDEANETIRYYRHHKFIRINASKQVDNYRYSLLNRHVPLVVRNSRGPSNLVLLQNFVNDDNLCYCDEKCITFGDCCFDYAFMCSPVDCIVGQWSTWSACAADEGECGLGTQIRSRKVERHPHRGGRACAALLEKTTCVRDCPQHFQQAVSKYYLTSTFTLFFPIYDKRWYDSAESSVALILNYSFNETREESSRHHRFHWDIGKTTNNYYCVTYQLGWVNANCVNKQITAKLFTGNKVCIECQPEAQRHRKTATCASDLNDRETGFWKLIGPKSCNGIWTRLFRTDNCRCAINIPYLDAFLFV
ncbi:unnamed protein product [Thelazia callipaeda]|uniref:SMB domain-containing protein n=1 Tax=Thelazia callipaeda TaxID=103827 RepID=A0A0N5D7I3_THECL|nr:unnamed protein product [Thelazia callipaeda]